MDDLSATALLDTVPIPTLVIGPQHTVLRANPPAQALFGAQILNLHFISALRQPTLVARIEACRDTQEPQVCPYTTTVGPADVTFDVQITPANGHLILSFLDRTDAQELDAIRRDFVANVSHELRTPLASIIGSIETLRGPARDDSAARLRFLGIMEAEAQRMSRLVNDLLSLSRVEENVRRAPTQRHEIAALVNQAIAELAPIIDAADASVSVEDDSAGCLVPADADQLNQVFRNLVENALRYGAKAGQVKITISAPAYQSRLRQNGVQIAVQDQGPGIAPHHLPRLTERFYRVDSHRSIALGGTGLGLAIVKHIIQRHRGHLKIDSALGKGSTFSVILPVSAEKGPLS